MKTTRQSDRNFWIAFGKRVAAKGQSLEWACGQGAASRNEAIRALVVEGFEAETKRQSRKAEAA